MSENDGIPNAPVSSEERVNRTRLTDIRKQMEFWFSSANLRRDWYLRRRMDPDGWIDPGMFLNFNLIKRLNASTAEIIEACRLSSIVEVSVPNDTFGDVVSQTRIRKADGPLAPVEDENLDQETARSIVAEKLPSDASCESLRKLFANYGDVTYVWLPKKVGGLLRGYALIMYESASTAARAITKFKEEQNRGEVSPQMTVKSKIAWERSFTSRKISSIIIEVTNLSTKTSWRSLWNELQPKFNHASIQLLYLSFRHGDEHCYITVRSEEEAKVAIDDVLTGMVVDGQELAATILTDSEALDKYWADAAQKMSQRKRQLATKATEPDSAESAFTPGIMVKVTGLPAGLYWRTVLDEMRQRGDVVFLRYNQRSGDCFVRFGAPRVAIESAEKVNNTKLMDYDVTAKVLEGEEEEQYWASVYEWKRKGNSPRQSAEVKERSHEPQENAKTDSASGATEEDIQRIFGKTESNGEQSPPLGDEEDPSGTMDLKSEDDDKFKVQEFKVGAAKSVGQESATAA